MYLETILVLLREKGAVRSLDVAEHMGFSKPSVSRAVGILKRGEYILVDRDGFITLTDSGMEIASKIYERDQAPRCGHDEGSLKTPRRSRRDDYAAPDGTSRTPPSASRAKATFTMQS